MANKYSIPSVQDATATPFAGWRPASAVWVSIVLVAVLWTAHVSMISQGGIRHWDEFYTFDRSASFDVQDDWLTVFTGNEPDFRKPPLQYWITALLLETGMDPVVALRLPSMLFGLGCLVTVALLGIAVLPESPWVMPAAILIYASSRDFWSNASSALLDAGASFFAALAMAATILALRRPGWWYVAGLAVGLGALQKAPAALFVVLASLIALRLTSRWHGLRPREIFRDRHFRAAAAIGLLLALAWPMVQFARYGSVVWQVAYADQIIDRFSPDNLTRTLADLDYLIINDEPVLRGLGIVALLCLPFTTRRPVLWVLTGPFVFYLAATYFAKGHVYPRYTLLFLPALAAALAATLLILLPANWQRLAAVVALVAILPFPIKTARELDLFPTRVLEDQIRALTEVGAALQPDETLVVCNWDRKTRFPTGAITIYAANGRPFIAATSTGLLIPRIEAEAPGRKLRGICTPADLEVEAGGLGDIVVVGESSGYRHWTSSGLSPTD